LLVKYKIFKAKVEN
jgi:hypothetical protein